MDRGLEEPLAANLEHSEGFSRSTSEYGAIREWRTEATMRTGEAPSLVGWVPLDPLKVDFLHTISMTKILDGLLGERRGGGV